MLVRLSSVSAFPAGGGVNEVLQSSRGDATFGIHRVGLGAIRMAGARATEVALPFEKRLRTAMQEADQNLVILLHRERRGVSVVLQGSLGSWGQVVGRLQRSANHSGSAHEDPIGPSLGSKATQWQAFLKKGKLAAGGTTLTQVCEFLAGFLMPPAQAIVGGTKFDQKWPDGGPWASGG